MAADDHPFFRMLAALDLADGDGRLGRPWTEGARQVDVHGDWSGLQQPIEQAVVLVRKERERQLRWLVSAEASHIEERIGLPTVHEKNGSAFVGNRLHELLALAKSSARSGGRNAVTGRDHGVVRVIRNFTFRGELSRGARDDDGAFELALIFLDVSGIVRVHKVDVPAHRAIGCFAPSQLANLNVLFYWRGYLRGVLSAGPGMWDFGCLQIRAYSIVLEALESPVAGPIHLWRSGETRADLRGQVFEVFHQFRVCFHLVGDFLIGLLHGRPVRAFILVASHCLRLGVRGLGLRILREYEGDAEKDEGNKKTAADRQ